MKLFVAAFALAFSSLTFAQGHFPVCNQSTSDVRLAEDMLRSVLGYMAPLSQPLKANIGLVKTVETTVQFKNNGGRLGFYYQRLNTISGNAVVCVEGERLKLTSSSSKYGTNVYYLAPHSRNSIRVSMKGTPGSAVFTAQ